MQPGVLDSDSGLGSQCRQQPLVVSAESTHLIAVQTEGADAISINHQRRSQQRFNGRVGYEVAGVLLHIGHVDRPLFLHDEAGDAFPDGHFQLLLDFDLGRRNCAGDQLPCRLVNKVDYAAGAGRDQPGGGIDDGLQHMI